VIVKWTLGNLPLEPGPTRSTIREPRFTVREPDRTNFRFADDGLGNHDKDQLEMIDGIKDRNV
jgi:hypothetical protein